MIIIKLWGGLCNQMFQYSFGYAQGRIRNDHVLFDVDFYKKQPNHVESRELELCKDFNIACFQTVDRPRSVKPFQNVLASNITRRLPNFHMRLADNIVYIKEKKHLYSDKLFYSKGQVNYYDGYWQSEKYFKDYKDDIREIFTFSNKTIDKVASWIKSHDNLNTVAIHIRRGDMSTGINKNNDNTIVQYYHNAMRYISERVYDPLFVVFSDDIIWCKDNLKDKDMYIVYQDQKWSAIEDLCGISLCEHGIMSKSTFSWWGNWLGKQEGRIVIAPTGITFNNEFVPSNWVICE